VFGIDQVMSQQNIDNDLRIDKWLWFARFFKSRSQATAAVAGGLVHVNGQRTKASYAVCVGDVIAVTRSEHHIEVMVKGIPVRRGPAPEAQTFYSETDKSIAEREQRRLHARSMPAPSGRPDKHDRRRLRILRGRDD
jgi:ribosome-associated heat shock protein Hsp15